MEHESIRRESGFCLPMDQVNRGGELVSKVRAVLDMMTNITEGSDVNHSTVSNAAWLLDDLMEELGEIISTRYDEASKECVEAAA